MNKEMYVDILYRVRDSVRRKCSEKWRINSWFLCYENAPQRTDQFWSNNNVTTLEHPPYSPDLSAADIYLFP